METIMFKKEQLGSYAKIVKPGKYELEVASNVTEKNLVDNRYIVNFKAIAADKLPQLKEAFSFFTEIPIDQTNGLFLTGNIWVNDGQAVQTPMKGEVVDVTIDHVEDREGQSVLRVTNIKLKPAVKAAKLDLASFFEETATAPPIGATLQHA